jgi:ubiquinone/menaquinone biosynthesis C-methylase UbiE
MADHHDLVRTEFSKQAPRFGEQGLALSSQEYLNWIVGAIAPQPGWRVLDVAAGTGHLARALAPHVAAVTALDLTPAMLEEGRRAAAEAGLANVTWERGAAERLPFPPEAFDAVVTRFSIHHFADPRPPLREMARVCRPGGRVAVVDLVTADDAAVAERHNRLERLRDPSHTRALTLDELTGRVREAGLAVERALSRSVEMDAGRWLEMTRTPPAARREITAAFQAELDGGPPTGMRPLRRQGRLWFHHTWAVLLAVKRAEP